MRKVVEIKRPGCGAEFEEEVAADAMAIGVRCPKCGEVFAVDSEGRAAVSIL